MADKKSQLPKKLLKRGQVMIHSGQSAGGGLPQFFEARARQAAKPGPPAKPEISNEEREKRLTATMTDLSLGGSGRLDFENPKWEKAFWRGVRARRRGKA